jgi:hypothetical protein
MQSYDMNSVNVSHFIAKLLVMFVILTTLVTENVIQSIITKCLEVTSCKATVPLFFLPLILISAYINKKQN